MSNKQLAKFITKKSKEIIIYEPSIDLFPKIFDFFNLLVQEDTYINRNEIKSFEKEKEKFQKRLGEIKAGDNFSAWAVHQNKIIGTCNVAKQSGRSKHIGVIGLMVDKDFRGEGIGRFLMDLLVKKAKKMGFRLLVLETFAENENALALYQKMGFKEFGRLPKALLYNNHYSDRIDMVKEL